MLIKLIYNILIKIRKTPCQLIVNLVNSYPCKFTILYYSYRDD